MILIQQDDFFPDIEQIRTWALSVPQYACEEYNRTFARVEDWPGTRSDLLSTAHPALHEALHQRLHLNPLTQGLQFHAFVHFRPEGTEDWIHMDREPLAGIIYINPTQTQSGTRMYSQDQQMITDVKYVQNRLLLYSGAYLHASYGAFGLTPHEGRTTLNLFLKAPA